MTILKPFFLGILLLALAPTLLLAQTDCPAIVKQALAAANTVCQNTGRNQACYGNLQLTAEPQPGVSTFSFSKAGDITNVANIKSMHLNPMDTTAGTWGVAMLRLQANLPDTLPGQNVTFLLFGDVQLDNAVKPGDTNYKPMQAFYFKSGIGDAPCAQAPESGLLVQTPKGSGQVAFNINGVDVQMGSTVFFQGSTQNQDSEMLVNTLEGAAFVENGNKTGFAVAGTRVRVKSSLLSQPSGGGGNPGAPVTIPHSVEIAPDRSSLELGESYDDSHFGELPLNLLQRKIEVHPPLTQEQLDEVEQAKDSGAPLCGEDPLPSCDHLPTELGGDLLPPDEMPMNNLPCVVRTSPDQTIADGETFCDELPQSEQDSLPCAVRADPSEALPADETRPACDEVYGGEPEATPDDTLTETPSDENVTEVPPDENATEVPPADEPTEMPPDVQEPTIAPSDDQPTEAPPPDVQQSPPDSPPSGDQSDG